MLCMTFYGDFDTSTVPTNETRGGCGVARYWDRTIELLDTSHLCYPRRSPFIGELASWTLLGWWQLLNAAGVL